MQSRQIKEFVVTENAVVPIPLNNEIDGLVDLTLSTFFAGSMDAVTVSARPLREDGTISPVEPLILLENGGGMQALTKIGPLSITKAYELNGTVENHMHGYGIALEFTGITKDLIVNVGVR